MALTLGMRGTQRKQCIVYHCLPLFISSVALGTGGKQYFFALRFSRFIFAYFGCSPWYGR